MRKLWDEREASARKVTKAAGAQIITDVDKKSFFDVLMPLYAQILNDSNLQDVVKGIQAVD